MKTLNGKNIARTASLAALALFATLNLAACGSSGGSSNTTAIPVTTGFGNSGLGYGYGGIGTGQSGYGSVIATSLSTMTYGGTPALQMGLQFSGNGGGQIGAQGYIYMIAPWQECGIPAGTYSLTTVQPGALSNGIVAAPVLMQASGAAGSFFVIVQPQDFFTPESQVGPDGTTFPYALQGPISFAINSPNNICNTQLAY